MSKPSIDEQPGYLPPCPLPECPGCGSTELEADIELEGESVDFVCVECKRRWHVELGYVHEVHTG